MKTYTLAVVAVRQETGDTVTLAFKQPGLKKIRYQSGQYLSLVFKINNRRYVRPYSFSSAPGVDTCLEVTIKRVSGGIVSNHICDVVKVGDVVEVLEPMGDFVIPQTIDYTDYNIVLWGAGSGVTPLFSMAKDILLGSNNRHVTLVYGNRTHDSVIFREQIAALALAYPNQFTVWYFYTQLVVTEEMPTIVQGRIDPSVVLEVLSQCCTITKTLHYICGPTGLKSTVKAALEQRSVPCTQIFSEDFELVKDEKDFIDITTQVVTIKNNGVAQAIEVVKGKSILEAGLDALLEMPYSCQTGNCSVCKSTLISGAVKQILPKHSDLASNDYQLCCTYPVSDNVVFEI